jgi:hypothetical protein
MSSWTSQDLDARPDRFYAYSKEINRILVTAPMQSTE